MVELHLLLGPGIFFAAVCSQTPEIYIAMEALQTNIFMFSQAAVCSPRKPRVSKQLNFQDKCETVLFLLLMTIQYAKSPLIH